MNSLQKKKGGSHPGAMTGLKKKGLLEDKLGAKCKVSQNV